MDGLLASSGMGSTPDISLNRHAASQTRGPRYLSLQAGRGLAALLVVLFHVGNLAARNPQLWNRPDIARWLLGCQLGVAFFFVLSGIVILSAHWNDIGHPATVPSYLWKRVRRIYPIYWLVLLGNQLSPANTLPPDQHHPWVLLSNILLVHVPSRGTNLAVAWTLFHEVLFYALFAVLLRSRRVGVSLLLVWLALGLVSLGVPLPLPGALSPLHLLFGMGMAVAWLLRRGTIPNPALLFGIGSSIFLGSLVFAGLAGKVTSSTYLSSGLGSAIMLLAAAQLETLRRLPVPRLLGFLGDASYSIYLIHFPVLATLAPICFRLDSQLHIPIAVWMLLLFTTGAAAGCLLYVLVERPLLRWMGGLRWPASPSMHPSAAAK